MDAQTAALEKEHEAVSFINYQLILFVTICVFLIAYVLDRLAFKLQAPIEFKPFYMEHVFNLTLFVLILMQAQNSVI